MSAQLAKYRRKAELAGGVAKLSPEERRAYGRAVFADVKMRNAPRNPAAHPCPCASGTWHTEPGKILAAVRQQQLAQLDRLAYQNRRTPRQWVQAYADAMGRPFQQVAEAVGWPR